MCGSFLLMALYSDLIKYYSIDVEALWEYVPGDYFPNRNAPIVIDDGKRMLQFAKWGFPFSGKSRPVINARAETVTSKPMFKSSFFYRRCVIPANGFYEWKQEESGKKAKYRIGLRDEPLISLGGIYKISRDENSIEQVTFVIITTEANEQLRPVHHRMPLIVRKEQLDLWLNNSTPQKHIMSILANDTYDGALVIEKETKEEESDSPKDSGGENPDQISLF